MINKMFNRVVGLNTLLYVDKLGPIRVIDGDDIEQGGVHYRLTGYDAPQITDLRSQFDRELECNRGLKAKYQLERLLSKARTIHIDDSQRALPRARRSARLIIDGKDVADTAIEMGWGRPYRERKSTDWGNPKIVFPDHLPMSEPSVAAIPDIAPEHLSDETVTD
jgi:endonuclease YncB( thermonuclease family)